MMKCGLGEVSLDPIMESLTGIVKECQHHPREVLKDYKKEHDMSRCAFQNCDQKGCDILSPPVQGMTLATPGAEGTHESQTVESHAYMGDETK